MKYTSRLCFPPHQTWKCAAPGLQSRPILGEPVEPTWVQVSPGRIVGDQMPTVLSTWEVLESKRFGFRSLDCSPLLGGFARDPC